MEQLKVEELEEVEKDEYVQPKEEKLKEYKKLLLIENNRQSYEKAVNLVKFGCFEQKEETEIDFNNFMKIETPKKFKGLYDLYQNLETMELVFICPLVEVDKADLENKKEAKPYAYDCIITEAVDEETYQMVCKSAKNNLSGTVRAFYIGANVAYFVLLFITLLSVIFSLIYVTSDTFNQKHDAALAITFMLFYSGALIGSSVIATPLIILMNIKYKKYKDQ